MEEGARPSLQILQPPPAGAQAARGDLIEAVAVAKTESLRSTRWKPHLGQAGGV